MVNDEGAERDGVDAAASTAMQVKRRMASRRAEKVARTNSMDGSESEDAECASNGCHVPGCVIA